MAKRRVGRIRRYSRKIRRRVGSQKFPLEMAVAAGAWALTPVADGWASPIDYVKTGNTTEIGKMLGLSFLGMNSDGKIDVAGILNPSAPQARFWKLMLLAGIMHKVRTKVVKIPMKRIPLIGRYIS